MPEKISVQDLIRQEAKSAGVPEALALSVADQESSFNPTAVGPKLKDGTQARGTFQLIPSTAQMLGVNIDDPVENIRGGVRYLRQLLDKHQGDLTKVLQEYGGVSRANTTSTYTQSVLGKLGKYQGDQAPSLGKSAAAPPAVGQPPPVGGLPPDRRANPQATPPSAEDFTRLSTTEKVARAVPLTGPELVAAGKSAAEQFDPRNPSGRRNIAGAVGGGVATALVPETGGLSALAIPVIGAAVGGGGETAIEQAVGTRPPGVAEPLVGAAEQGATELGGQIIPWAAKGLLRRGTAFVAQKAGTSALGSLLASLPESDAAGVAARDTIRGGAQTARDLAGQAVDQAAREGPMVDLRPLKKEAQAIVDRIAKPETTFPRHAPEPAIGVGGGTSALLEQRAARGDPQAAQLLRDLQGGMRRGSLADAQAEADRETLKHPAMGVVNRILNADDTVPFEDAHLFKRDLDQSLQGKWDQNPSAKKQVTSLTQHLRGGLRDTLAVHEPYNQATAAYAKIVPLYDKEYAARFRRAAQTDPGSLVRSIQLNKPTPLRMLRDLLVQQSAAGGRAEEGQAAWNQVRGAVVRTKILNRGFEGLDAQLGKISKETRGVLFGDAQGSTVENNLRMIAAASKVAKQRLTTEQTVAHGARATLLTTGNLWGALSAAKLALTGPQQRDLLEWAAYSPQNTKTLVNLITGGSPSGAAIADVLRGAGIVPEKAATPPPTDRSRVGQPPPIGR